MRDFFPEIEPYKVHQLQVSDLHTISFEEAGNPQGYPIVFLHGGPGGGIEPKYRRFFDPKHYRIVLIDQRGCGKSVPYAELRENTTWDLVADVEKVREKLGINKWHVFGGSWGSTLALAYAITHSERVSGLILRGIFLCRPSEIQWFYQHGAHNIFPDLWQPYWNYIPESERGNMVQAYHKRLTSEDSNTRTTAAKIWSQWEAGTSYLHIQQENIDHYGDPEKAVAFARIECHYFMNNAFFPTDNYLLENVHKIKNIPGIIIQGRYDVVCPPRSAWDLHQAWPESQLQWIADAGHAASETGIRSALIEATEKFKSIGHK